MSEKNEYIQQRVMILSDKVNEFLIEECKKDNYSAAELYMTITYLKKRFEKVLGPAFIKQMDQVFTIIDLDDVKEC